MRAPLTQEQQRILEVIERAWAQAPDKVITTGATMSAEISTVYFDRCAFPEVIACLSVLLVTFARQLTVMGGVTEPDVRAAVAEFFAGLLNHKGLPNAEAQTATKH